MNYPSYVEWDSVNVLHYSTEDARRLVDGKDGFYSKRWRSWFSSGCPSLGLCRAFRIKHWEQRNPRVALSSSSVLKYN